VVNCSHFFNTIFLSFKNLLTLFLCHIECIVGDIIHQIAAENNATNPKFKGNESAKNIIANSSPNVTIILHHPDFCSGFLFIYAEAAVINNIAQTI